MAYFGLIRSVGGIPTGVFEDVALDDGGGDGVVVTHTDIRLEQFVLLSQSAATVEELIFVDAVGDRHRFVEAYGLGDGLVDKILHRGDADGFEHFFFVGGIGNAIVTSGKIIGNHRIVN